MSEKQERIKIINYLNEELKEIDLLNILDNYKFSYDLKDKNINEAKKFIKEFKIKYENLELLLQELIYNEDLSLLINCNVYDVNVNDFIFSINEENKKRLEEYVEKLNFKNKLENNLTINTKEKRSKI